MLSVAPPDIIDIEDVDGGSFPYVVIFGDVELKAIEELMKQIVAFDEVYVGTEVLSRACELARSSKSERLADKDGVIAELFGHRQPDNCRGTLIDYETLEPLYFEWTYATELVRESSGYYAMSTIWYSPKVWSTSSGYLRTHQESYK